MTSNDGHTDYFGRLNAALKKYARAIPCMLVDLDRVDHNIARFQATLNPKCDVRLVVKSLPSWPLIQYISQRLGTNKLMVFHQPFLTDLTSKLNAKADVLLGKPMPIKTACYYYDHLPECTVGFDPYRQIQWLVDTQVRLEEYTDLAKTLGRKLRLNLEIDVGLHRGGFATLEELSTALAWFQTHPDHIEFSGFMGYDPHVVKMPRILRSVRKGLEKSNQFYRACTLLVQTDFPDLWHDDLTFNGAGSPTASLHQFADSPLNDIAAGSCFVKPSTFDIPTLEDYLPTCFIATPVLKKLSGTQLPGLETFRSWLPIFKPSWAQSFFIYGGYWKADYVFPPGVRENKLFGPSTNQSMINAPRDVKLAVDDFVFLRPWQSEFV
ncbi:MAG: alanine racemase, partial [Bacteroidota bacterium]